MSRYVQNVVLNKPDDFVNYMMTDFIQKYEFSLYNWKGETCYRRGDAMLEGYRYFTWGYQNGVLHIEAWLKGISGQEMGLTGFWGFAVKSAYRNMIDSFIQLLLQPLPANMNAQNPTPACGMPQYTPNTNQQAYNMAQQAPIMVQGIDNYNDATIGMVLGILCIPLSLFIPYLGVLGAVFGYIFATKGKHSSRSGQAMAGLVCSTVGIILAFAVIIIRLLSIFL